MRVAASARYCGWLTEQAGLSEGPHPPAGNAGRTSHLYGEPTHALSGHRPSPRRLHTHWTGAAPATAVTFNFTGTVTSAGGIFSSLTSGTVITGTDTINFANAHRSQTS